MQWIQAPECIHDRELSYKTDIYSLGVIIIEIISGEKNPTNQQLNKAVRDFTIQDSYDGLTILPYACVYCFTLLFVNAIGTCSKDEGMSEQIKKCIQLARDCREKEPDKRPDTKKVRILV
jgi:serine/threonine protein kinase